MKPSSDWIYKLSCSDVEEIDEALRLVAALGLRKEVQLACGIELCQGFRCIAISPMHKNHMALSNSQMNS